MEERSHFWLGISSSPLFKSLSDEARFFRFDARFGFEGVEERIGRASIVDRVAPKSTPKA